MRGCDRPKLTYANVVSTLCLFLLVAGGGAYAATKLAKNSVGTKQIRDGAVNTSKLADSSATGSKIGDGSISLGKLGSDVLGDSAVANAGNGDHPSTSCNPADLTGIICDQVTVKLTRPGRLLAIGDGRDEGNASGEGACQLFEGTIGNGIGPGVGTIPQGQPFSIAAITGVLPPGTHTVGTFCTQGVSDAIFGSLHLAVVTLSSN